MRQVRRWFGRLTIGVGLVGVLSSVLGLVILWRATTVISSRTVEIANLVVDVQDNADQYVGKAENVVENMQQKVRALKESADKVSEDVEGNRSVVPTLEKLDGEIVRELGEARKLLESIQSGMAMLDQAVGLFDSLSSPARMFRRSSPPRENSDLSQLSQSLVASSEQLQQVIDFVAQMEQQGITDQQARELQLAVAQLGSQLEQGRERLSSLRSFLQATRDNVVTMRTEVPFWANAVAIFGTVLFTCFCFTQIQLVGFGRSILTATSRSPVAAKRAQAED
jgi:predicted PurR-regulated permease PerM